MRPTRIATLVVCLGLVSFTLAAGQVTQETADGQREKVFDFSAFKPERWVINAKTTRLLDREDEDGKKYRILRVDQAQKELAYVRDFVFRDGTIECDLRGGAYLGIAFRIRKAGKAEIFYFRPPPVTGWKNTIQYLARGLKNWDSWEWMRENHPGRYETGLVAIPGNKPGRDWWNDPDSFSEQWFHVKVVVSGKKAEVFVDDNQKPSLVVRDLKHGELPGTVGLYAWRGEFRNFKVRVATEGEEK